VDASQKTKLSETFTEFVSDTIGKASKMNIMIVNQNGAAISLAAQPLPLLLQLSKVKLYISN